MWAVLQKGPRIAGLKGCVAHIVVELIVKLDSGVYMGEHQIAFLHAHREKIK